MKDIEVHLEKLRVQIVECELIRDLATEPKKREMFTRLAEHFRTLATELERALSHGLPRSEAGELNPARKTGERRARAFGPSFSRRPIAVTGADIWRGSASLPRS